MSITDLAQGPPNQNKRVALVKDIIGLVASGRVIGDALVGVQAAASVGKPIDDRGARPSWTEAGRSDK